MSTPSRPSIALSELDRLRFGIVTACASATTVADLLHYDDFCRANAVRLLMVRCPTSAADIVQALEKQGAQLTDCLIRYRRNLRKYPLQDLGDLSWIREARPEDVPGVAAVATQAFTNYGGHYHADRRLKSEDADDVYRDWAIRSCTDESVAERVFVASENDAIVGFITVRRNSPLETEAPLGAAAPGVQGRGIPNALVVRALQWSLGIGARWSMMSTRVSNITAQKALFRNRYEVVSSSYVIHRWYDDSSDVQA